METKIVITNDPVTLDDLSALFNDGVILPNVKVEEVIKTKPIKPFQGILANNLHQLIEKQNFDGEPFLKGDFEYRLVQLPNCRKANFPGFYSVLSSILNGYQICTGASKEALKALADEIYYHYAPIGHVTIKQHSPQREASFDTISRIIEQVVEKPRPFNGRRRKKNIIWNPDYDFTGDEKRQIAKEYRDRKNAEEVLKKLMPLFEKSLTKTEIIEITGFSKSTIKRYKRKWKLLNLEPSSKVNNLKAA